jgi:NADH-quinone oxidoreductase subunit K
MPSIVTSVPLEWVLSVGAALFSIGLFGALGRRDAIGIVVGVELMLAAVNINLVAFWRYLEPASTNGLVFALMAGIVAVAQVAIVLALVIAAARRSARADDATAEGVRQ